MRLLKLLKRLLSVIMALTLTKLRFCLSKV